MVVNNPLVQMQALTCRIPQILAFLAENHLFSIVS